MRVLAIETATPLASVALVDAAGTAGESVLRAPMRHLEWLVPAVDEMLRSLGWTPAEVEGVAVSRGPGGFTGLRVGIATAAAWARARDVPLLGVGTLDALALAPGVEGLVLPALDAHRGEVAAALFRVAAEGPAPAMPPVVAAPDVVVRDVLAALGSFPVSEEPVLLVGDGLLRHRAALLGGLGPRARAAAAHLHPRAALVGRLARPRLLAGRRDDPAGFVPVYGRRPAARVWQETYGEGGNRE